MIIDKRKGVQPNVTLNTFEASALKSDCRRLAYNSELKPYIPTYSTKSFLTIAVADNMLVYGCGNSNSSCAISTWYKFYRVLISTPETIYISPAAYERLKLNHWDIFTFIRKLNEFSITEVTIF